MSMDSNHIIITIETYNDSTPKQLFSRTISDWNKLPTRLIEVADSKTFKTNYN